MKKITKYIFLGNVTRYRADVIKFVKEFLNETLILSHLSEEYCHRRLYRYCKIILKRAFI